MSRARNQRGWNGDRGRAELAHRRRRGDHKVRYAGTDNGADRWVKADVVTQEQHARGFEKRKDEKGAQG